MILLIDGNNLAHRTFHTGSGTLTTKNGTPSGVILGSLRTLKSYTETFSDATRVIVAWDGGRSRWRKEAYPAYKGNRDYGKDDPEKQLAYQGLWNQIDELHNILPSFGMHSIRIHEQEADDVIAACARLKDEDRSAMIITSDEDMFQLVSDSVFVMRPHNSHVLSPLNFYESTGVKNIDAYPGYRAMVGDTSDNIIGIKGIGAKIGARLVNQYGHIDNILNATGDDKKTLLKSKVTQRLFTPEGLETIAVNNKIMSFKFCEYDKIEDEAVKALERDIHASVKEVQDICRKWEFVSVLSDFRAWSQMFERLS